MTECPQQACGQERAVRILARLAMAGVIILLLTLSLTPIAKVGNVLDYIVRGDSIAEPLTDKVGRAHAGRAVFVDRESGNCLLCHTVNTIGESSQGNLGPDLSRGTLLTDAQVRLRLVDSSRVNPQTVMPSYYRIDGLTQVATAYKGRPALTAQQVEDLIAFLRSLKTSGNSK